MKEKVGLSAAITGILTGCFYFIIMGTWTSIFEEKALSEESVQYVLVSAIGCLSVAVIVVSSIFCAKRKKIGLAKALFILLILMSVLQIVGLVKFAGIDKTNYTMTILTFAFGILNIVQMVMFFYLKTDKNALEPLAAGPVNPNSISEKEQKIALLKRLKEQGDITEEEFKERLFDELDS